VTEEEVFVSRTSFKREAARDSPENINQYRVVVVGASDRI
jgi:hypothetical protein